MVYSYVTPKVEVRAGAIDGVGSFAIDQIAKDEIVFIKGGYILTWDTALLVKRGDNYWPLSDDLLLAPKKDSDEEEIKQIKIYINHSCNANCGMRGEITGVAMRKIEIGEEVTFDYAMIDDDNHQSYNFKCTCGELNCRKNITGKDWMIPKLQKKYKGYFATYLQEKMNRLP